MSNIFHFKKSNPRSFGSGDLFRASSKNFPVLKGLAIQAVDLEIGGVREPHAHPNAHQLDYCVSGQGLVGIVGPDGETHYLELEPGDISFVPQGFLHWIENRGSEPLHFLVVLSHEEPQTIELSEMLRGVPNSTLAKMYDVSEQVFERIPAKTVVIGGHGSRELDDRGHAVAAE
ncbi:cupin domain-containing protein [Marinivivus vitaminiproducens]|uniref:cupin domain-containing protein n=1 Tax=Marinivivus vitaminiproducens TaxID=3035935 RepID=UPI00279C86D6|nr:cupin domain-containing protein [Geminicoccaceae bacterium SCSIO 64248]